MPLDFVGWIVRECSYSGKVRTGVDVRDAPGDTDATEFEVDVDRWAPPTSPAASHGTGAYEPGEEVVFEFPHEHREEIEESLAIYAHRQDEGSSDIYLWGTISPEAEHAGYTLSWIPLSGDVPKDRAVGDYECTHFTARYARNGAIDLDGRLIPETIEIVDREGRPPRSGARRAEGPLLVAAPDRALITSPRISAAPSRRTAEKPDLRKPAGSTFRHFGEAAYKRRETKEPRAVLVD